MIDSKVESALREVEQLDTRADLEEPLYRISRDNGVFLHMLVRMSKATRILEIGSSGGYSGLFLASAAKANGGHVTTCELSPFKIQLARETYEEAGLSDFIHVVEGDARVTVTELEGPWDFVFIDAWKEDYSAYLHAVWPKVASGGIVTADDIISQARTGGIQAYMKAVRSLPGASTVTVPIDDGVELTRKD